VQRPQGRSSLARPPPRGAKCARGGQQPRAPAQLLAPWQPAQRAPRRQAAPYPAAAYTPPAAAARARAHTHLKPSPAARQPRAPGGARTGLRAAPPTWPRLTGPSRHPASARHRLYARRRVSPARASDARRPMPPPHGGKRSTPKRQTSFVDLTYRVLHEPCPSYKLKEGPASSLAAGLERAGRPPAPDATQRDLVGVLRAVVSPPVPAAPRPCARAARGERFCGRPARVTRCCARRCCAGRRRRTRASICSGCLRRSVATGSRSSSATRMTPGHGRTRCGTRAAGAGPIRASGQVRGRGRADVPSPRRG